METHRKEAVQPGRNVVPTIIGAGITEQWYFTHLQRLFNLRMKIRPRFFGNENISALEKRISTVLEEGGKAVVVFDEDVSTWNEPEKKRLRKMRQKYSRCKMVVLCSSMPSIEYWFLLHYADIHRYFNSSASVVGELRKHVVRYNKTEEFLKGSKWVTDLCSNGKLEEAYRRAKSTADNCNAHTNMWKAMDECGVHPSQTPDETI